MSSIFFDSVLVPQDKKGAYSCPFCNGDPRFPPPKWKTERGILNHISKCTSSPSAMAAKKKQVDINDQRKKDSEIEYNKCRDQAIASCPVKIGDEVFFVDCEVKKPTHDSLGRRLRYEEHRHYFARRITVDRIGFTGFEKWNANQSGADVVINGIVKVGSIKPTMKEAETEANRANIKHKEALVFSSNYR